MIRSRRDRITRRYLPAVTPVVAPALADRRLTFANAAVDAGISEAPAGYRAAWSLFDNATSTSTALAVTDGSRPSLPVPDIPSTAGFVKVDIAATGEAPEPWRRPVTVYFRRDGGSGSLVGLERLPDDEPREP